MYIYCILQCIDEQYLFVHILYTPVYMYEWRSKAMNANFTDKHMQKSLDNVVLICTKTTLYLKLGHTGTFGQHATYLISYIYMIICAGCFTEFVQK